MFLLMSTSVCKISRVRSVTEFDMVQGGRGGTLHERAATLPSPAPGLEKGDVESLRLAVLYMRQVRHIFYRAQVQEPESSI